ncbi:MAG TPA: hypothetical protein VGS20_05335 [Candidatus Acidoferrales bacterium]|nr:hypothetical protein [Candidatus Acidoferrales bacterium]
MTEKKAAPGNKLPAEKGLKKGKKLQPKKEIQRAQTLRYMP